MISCGCDVDDGIGFVGDMRLVTCRNSRCCDACGKGILKSEKMYFQSRYDYGASLACSPWIVCEDCGDLAMTLAERGFCFYTNDSIRSQWLDYLEEVDPDNVSIVKRRGQR